LSSDPLDHILLDEQEFEFGAEVDQELDNEILHMMAQRVVRKDRVITTILPQPFQNFTRKHTPRMSVHIHCHPCWQEFWRIA
jgi:hypothetical protein